jgi:hypothetical protein
MKPYPDHQHVSVLSLGSAEVVERLSKRISRFPRVWAAVSTADGREGVGWFEWNRNTSQR